MASVDELKKKAAELEHAERLSEALEPFLRLAHEAQGPLAAAYWRRAASLQNRLGQKAEAADSYARALDAFIAADLPNDAMATGLDMLAIGDPDPRAVSRLLQLAMDGGYGRFAQTAATALFRSAVNDPDPSILDALAGYLGSKGTSATVVEELLPADHDDDPTVILPTLKAIWSRLEEAGRDDAAEVVRAAIGRIDPTEVPAPAPVEAPADRPVATEPAPADPLPLIEQFPDDEDPSSIPLLEGLEPTHAVDDDGPDIISGESLVVEHTSMADGFPPPDSDPPALVEREEDVDGGEEDEEDYVEPLPLLEPSSRPPSAAPGLPPTEGYSADDVPHANGQRLAEAADCLDSAELDVDAILRDLSSVATGDVEAGDAASHYDVGVAFKEMGMTRDALARLRAALEGGHNPLATLEVVGEILVAEGEIAAAARILRHARVAGDAPDEERAGVLYWLARGEEALGRAKEAGLLFERVVRAVPDYRDAAERLGRLSEPAFDTRKQLD